MKVDIRERAFEFACHIITLHRALTRKRGNAVAANQLLRAGTAVGSNLEEAEAAQSHVDFVSKVRIALKEARESHYWLRLVARTQMVAPNRVQPLIQEANALVAILTKIVKNATTPATSPSRPSAPAS